MLLVLATAGTTLLMAAPAGAAPPRALPDCLGHPQVKPRSVVFACADANFGVDGLDWLSWGGARAVALGSAYVNDCKPYCAAGHFARYPTVVIASGAQRCPDGREAYRTVTYAFIGRSPFPSTAAGTRNPRQDFPCRKLP